MHVSSGRHGPQLIFESLPFWHSSLNVPSILTRHAQKRTLCPSHGKSCVHLPASQIIPKVKLIDLAILRLTFPTMAMVMVVMSRLTVLHLLLDASSSADAAGNRRSRACSWIISTVTSSMSQSCHLRCQTSLYSSTSCASRIGIARIAAFISRRGSCIKTQSTHLWWVYHLAAIAATEDIFDQLVWWQLSSVAGP